LKGEGEEERLRERELLGGRKIGAKRLWVKLVIRERRKKQRRRDVK